MASSITPLIPPLCNVLWDASAASRQALHVHVSLTGTLEESQTHAAQ